MKRSLLLYFLSFSLWAIPYLDISEVSLELQTLAQSVAMEVSSSSVKEKDGKIILKGKRPKDFHFEAAWCSDQKFAEIISVGSCTGFLVADDLLVTAAHCVTGKFYNYKPRCSNSDKWIFGVNNLKQWTEIIVDEEYDYTEVNTYAEISTDDIYYCKEVVEGFYAYDISFPQANSYKDFILLRLDRKVRGRQPLKMGSSKKLKLGDPVFSIGHPKGLPSIYTMDGQFTKHSTNKFGTTLPIMHGGSGSPVFSGIDGKVVGIATMSQTHGLMTFDPYKGCLSFTEDFMGFSNINRIELIQELINYDLLRQQLQ